MDRFAISHANTDTVAAAMFGLVQGLIGIAQDGVQSITWLAEVPAHADGKGRAGVFAFLFYTGANAAGDLLERYLIAGRQQHHKFVTTPAARMVIGPYRSLQPLGNIAENLVSGLMAA